MSASEVFIRRNNNKALNEKCSIKNMLFSKQMPNYNPPILSIGHKVYTCIDCGDRFILQCSYEYHINRKSLKITFGCQYCHKTLTFYNRCNLLQHIRSHAYRTATLNLSDLQVEPLQLCDLQMLTQKCTNGQSQTPQKGESLVCYDCGSRIPLKTSPEADRAKHYMNYNTKLMFTCPICLFLVPTACALQTHLRIHYNKPPNYCPECGIVLDEKNLTYPFSHDCEGFRMIRATTRLKCPVDGCEAIHPTTYKEHMKKNHIKVVYKCPKCVVACFTPTAIKKHMSVHNINSIPTIFYQCQLCPGRLVIYTQIINHLNQHNKNTYVYPCWACGKLFDSSIKLVEHYHKNCPKSRMDYVFLKNNTNVSLANTEKNKFNNFELQKNYHIDPKDIDKSQMMNDNSGELFSITPVTNTETLLSDHCSKSEITCSICKLKVDENWNKIKVHFKSHHIEHKCLDIVVRLQRMGLQSSEFKNKKRNKRHKSQLINNIKLHKNKQTRLKSRSKPDDNPICAPPTLSGKTDTVNKFCSQCGIEIESEQHFQDHIIAHRDPCSAYQCLECGMSFAVKPSFSMHLLAAHDIIDAEDYIKKKPCYNEEAFTKQNPSEILTNEPVAENQCKICREQFNNEGDLEKHFRVHGMAFLMTKKICKT